jgi:hypothetical protein
MPKKRVTETTVYQFDELSDTAKEKAREWYLDGGLDYEWWDGVCEDAARVGLAIKGFDIDRGNYCEGDLTTSPLESIEKILDDHGEDCDTYKLALLYKPQFEELDRKEQANEDEDYSGERDELESEYTYALREEYLSILRKEYEYLTSNECVDDTIRANEYEFLEGGERS